MKKHLTLGILLFISIECYSQYGFGYINFDSPSYLTSIVIDTSNSNNIWQVGRPEKTLFTEAYSFPRAIITDSINPYPPDNDSYFYLWVVVDYFPWLAEWTDFDFYYKIDCNSLLDYGRVEYSFDHGITYHNIFQTCQYKVLDASGNLKASNGYGNPIVLTGQSNDWLHCSFTLGMPANDSVVLRFTFHSDSIPGTHDGWMIDDISWESFWEGINEKCSYLNIFPNPTETNLTIGSNTRLKEISIITSLGEGIYHESIFTSNKTINTEHLKTGLYYLKILEEDGKVMLKKFIKL
jgi:hypothetical protein